MSAPESTLAVKTQNESRAQSLAFALLLAMTVSASGGLILLALRLPAGGSAFSIGPLHFLRGFGLMLAFVLSLALMIEKRSRPSSIALVPVALISLFVQGGAMVAPFADAALLLSLLVLLAKARQRQLLSCKQLGAMLFLGFVIAGAGMAAMVLKGYSHPLAFENALLGRQFRDTLFQASIAGSLQYSHVASIGLDGLVGLNYHTLSHRLIGAFATWSDLPDLMAYSLFVPVVGIPVLIFLVLTSLAVSRQATAVSADPFVAVMALVALALLLNTAALMSIWFSESFVIGLWVLMLALLVMACCEPRKVDFATGASLALLVFLASQAKISVGAILASGVCTWLALSFGIWGFVMAAVFGAMPFLFVYFSSYSQIVSDGGEIFGLFYLYRRVPEIFIAVILGFFIIYRLNKFDVECNKSILKFRISIFVMLLSGFICGVILRLPGLAEAYFVSPALWAVLFYIGFENQVAGWPPKGSFVSRRTIAVVAAILAAVLAILVFTRAKPQRILHAYLDSLGAIAQVSNGEGTRGLLARTVFGQIVDQIEADPTIEAVQVDPRVRQIWDGHEFCWTASFVIPATTRRPMLDGLPPLADHCELPLTYGFADYRPEVSSARILDDAAVCEKAATLSLKRILRVGPDGMTTLNCEN